MKGKGREGKGR